MPASPQHLASETESGWPEEILRIHSCFLMMESLGEKYRTHSQFYPGAMHARLEMDYLLPEGWLRLVLLRSTSPRIWPILPTV